MSDLRLALRTLARNPGFAAVTVLSLALGIGANTAIFSVVDAVVLKMLPVRDPERLVTVASAHPRGVSFGFSHPLYVDLRDGGAKQVELIASATTALSLAAGGQTDRALGEIVSGNYFPVLGVRPALGRLLGPEDDRNPGGHPVAVLSHGLWRRRFGGDPSVVGAVISLNARAFTVVGVAAANFTGVRVGMAPEIWAPMAMQVELMPGWKALGDRRRSWLELLGRLRPGVTLPQAQAALGPAFQQAMEQWGRSLSPGVPPAALRSLAEQRLLLQDGAQGRSFLRQFAARPLLVLMAVAGFVLLIACANVANLLLARAAGRSREIAVRLALGASRGRLVRQLLAESLLLSLAGGLAGLLVALPAGSLLLSLLPQGPEPVVLDVRTDWRAIAFTFAVSILTAVLFGLAPAFESTRAALVPALKEEAGMAARSGRLMLRKALVAGQVALSLLLLAGAGLFLRTLWNLRELDPGFRREQVLLATLDPSLGGYDDAQASSFYRQLLDRVSGLPGVRAAALARTAVLSGMGMRRTMSVAGYQPQPGEDMNMNINFISPGYFRALGIALPAGRDFDARDREGAPRVAIVNETLARRFWPRKDPIGQRLQTGLPGNFVDIEVVGVARDSKYRTLREQTPATVYVPFVQEARIGEMTLHVRSAGDPLSLAAAVRGAVGEMARHLPVFQVRTLEDQTDAALAQERMTATLTGFFAALALLLAAVGLYGVIAYVVAGRRREIGIRMALGAGRWSVVALVLRESLLMVGIGLAIGLALSAWAIRLVASQLYGVGPADPLTLAAGVGLLAVAALLAAFLPARRAAAVDPVRALRYE
jgi:predicted permease